MPGRCQSPIWDTRHAIRGLRSRAGLSLPSRQNKARGGARPTQIRRARRLPPLLCRPANLHAAEHLMPTLNVKRSARRYGGMAGPRHSRHRARCCRARRTRSRSLRAERCLLPCAASMARLEEHARPPQRRLQRECVLSRSSRRRRRRARKSPTRRRPDFGSRRRVPSGLTPSGRRPTPVTRTWLRRRFRRRPRRKHVR